MAAKLNRLTHKIAMQLHLVAESCTICSSSSRRPVRKLLDTPSYIVTLVERELPLRRHFRESFDLSDRSHNFCGK
jgi:hypothetical protein